MTPVPQAEKPQYRGSGKLQDRVALITGGDSGIGRAIAIAFAHEGADVAICHLEEETTDAEETAERVRELGSRALLQVGDIGRAETCKSLIARMTRPRSFGSGGTYLSDIRRR